MLRATLAWRAETKPEQIRWEDVRPMIEYKGLYPNGFDREGTPTSGRVQFGPLSRSHPLSFPRLFALAVLSSTSLFLLLSVVLLIRSGLYHNSQDVP
jgi:hypothetical protein